MNLIFLNLFEDVYTRLFEVKKKQQYLQEIWSQAL